MDDGEESDGILYSNILVVFRRYAPVRIYIFNELKLGEFVKKYDSKLDFNPKSIPKLESNVKLT